MNENLAEFFKICQTALGLWERQIALQEKEFEHKRETESFLTEKEIQEECYIPPTIPTSGEIVVPVEEEPAEPKEVTPAIETPAPLPSALTPPPPPPQTEPEPGSEFGPEDEISDSEIITKAVSTFGGKPAEFNKFLKEKFPGVTKATALDQPGRRKLLSMLNTLSEKGAA